MIQERSILKLADNSGAKTARCFRILGGGRKRYASIGDIIIVSIREAEPRKQVKKKDVIKAVVVRQRAPLRRKDGSYIRFYDNSIVIIDEKKEPKATRVFGPIPREIREKGFEKVAALAEELV